MRTFLWMALCALPLPISPAFAQANAPVAELPRAGAPRPLRLLAPDGLPLRGTPTDVVWERRGGGLFFTLEREGTRNIWRAFPDPQDSSRFPAWRALPITNLRAPLYAAQPSPLPGDRVLVCVSNALASAPAAGAVAQIVRYDLASAQFRALSDGVRLYDAPQVSPDGARVAFVGGQGSGASVFVAPTDNPQNRVLPAVTQLMSGARRPVWLDNDSLLIESLAPTQRGLYVRTTSANAMNALRVVVGGGGEAGALGAGGVVFSAKTSAGAPPSLYIVARDGSGLRILNETAGARRPAAAPDGLTLAYDAPLSAEREAQRALWVVPLVRPESRRVNAQVAEPPTPYEVPTAQLSSARAAREGIAVVGALRGAANSTIKLEVGEGEKPRRWQEVPVVFPPTSPLLDGEGNRVLATWNPPPRARGTWTLRLSLSGLGGGAQSLLRVKLPLPAPAATPDLPVAPPRIDSPSEPFPRATPLPNLPDVVPARGASTTVPPIASDDNGDGDLPVFPPMTPYIAPPDAGPIPPPIVATPKVATPNVVTPNVKAPNAPAKTPTTAGSQIVPIDPSRVGAPTPVVPPITPSPVVPDDGNYGEMPTASAREPWVAQFNVSGTPARAQTGETVKVTFWGLNRGSSPWETGSSGENRVRLVARWVDFSTGTRRQWNYFWLREAVAPGERTKWEFDLPVPARAGKYKLIYGLVRLPERGEYAPPAYSAPQESWQDEFGAIAFAVEVADGGEDAAQ